MGFCITRHQWAALWLLYGAKKAGLSARALADTRSARSGRSGLPGAYAVLKSLESKRLALRRKDMRDGQDPRVHYVITPLGVALVKVGAEVERLTDASGL
jgi:DNA-binding PadR family transcriptional regulator